ncbi:MAG: class I SAM-dependent methyltransferase [Sphingomonadales bacterium]|nr:class I SAM-dependent methyltransferase [Sphingomonadales bacterium]
MPVAAWRRSATERIRAAIRKGFSMSLLRQFFRRRKPEGPATPRDTDRDWQIIGASEPYYGVLSHDRFRRENLDPQAIDEFYQSGVGDIDHAWQRMAQLGRFAPRSALDFGCGVGRLSIPLAQRLEHVVGVDISPGMIEQARLRAPENLEFSSFIPADRTVDWVISLIVFQHIPPSQGLAQLRKLLGCLSQDGGVTLQFMFARSEALGNSVGGRVVLGPDGATAIAGRLSAARVPEGTMLMHDYDMSVVLAELHGAGINRLAIEFCDHGGHVGATLYGLRNP